MEITVLYFKLCGCKSWFYCHKYPFWVISYSKSEFKFKWHYSTNKLNTGPTFSTDNSQSFTNHHNSLAEERWDSSRSLSVFIFLGITWM